MSNDVDWTYVALERDGEVKIVEVPLAQIDEVMKNNVIRPVPKDLGDRLTEVFQRAVDRARRAR